MQKIVLFVVCFILTSGAFAETIWSDYSVSYLKGSNYQVGDNDRQVVTFEYAAGMTWGDVFSFVDRLESDNGDTDTYAEFSPRFTLKKFDKNNFLTQVSIASMVEIGDGFTNYLLGVGTNLNIPHFKFFNVNFYRRNNDFGDNSWQITPVWAIPFNLGNTKWQYSGFIDWVSSTDAKPSSFNFTSQLGWNIGDKFALQSPLFLGVEYVYWNNKFGISDINERNVNLLIKWHF